MNDYAAISRDPEKKRKATSALFAVLDAQMDARSDGEIDRAVVAKCVDAIPRIDPFYLTPEGEKEAAAERAAEIYLQNHAEKRGGRKRLSVAIKIGIIAAIISALLAGAAAFADVDIDALFFAQKDITEWEDGETHTIGNYTVTVSQNVREYATLGELIADKDAAQFIIPTDLPEEYEVESASFDPLKGREKLFVHYRVDGREVDYYAYTSDKTPAPGETDSREYDSIVSAKGAVFYIMENEDGWQAVCWQDGKVYNVTAARKKDVINFIKNTKEI